MQRLFNDQGGDGVQIRSNPFGTKPVSLPDVVAKRMQWLASRRVWRLAGNQMGCADAASLTISRA